MNENYSEKNKETKPNYSLRRKVAAGIAGFIASALLYLSVCAPKNEAIIPPVEPGAKIELSDIAEYKKNHPDEFLTLVTGDDIGKKIESNQETFNQYYNKVNKLADSGKFELSKENRIYEADKAVTLFNSKPELSELCNEEFQNYQLQKVGRKVIGGIYEAGKDGGSGIINGIAGDKE